MHMHMYGCSLGTELAPGDWRRGTGAGGTDSKASTRRSGRVRDSTEATAPWLRVAARAGRWDWSHGDHSLSETQRATTAVLGKEGDALLRWNVSKGKDDNHVFANVPPGRYRID